MEELHALLTNDLGVDKGLRKSPVGIVGTNYKPLSNQLQIKDAVDKLIATINATENVNVPPKVKPSLVPVKNL